MLDHLTSGKNAALIHDLDTQLTHQMTLTAVGSVTTFATTMQCLYDLAAHPQMVQVLRDEVIAVKESTSGTMFDKESIQHLNKMDSFMKESQRLSSPDLTTFQRAATADITLPDGTFIPKGTKLETATCAIHADDANYENATQFDGLRFYRSRKMDGEENKHMFVSVGPKDLAFGIGRHACPGRFLSNIVIKLILSEFLLNYDIRLPDGASRPTNIEYEISVSHPYSPGHLIFYCYVV
ncbi:cytochrome P450 [Penicillium brevicompactum]|uniref:Cytochrome P450 n=1 Tax=Penicillium brevicompactum TaxID=5074 RepID=A0A9W9V0E3_PENBR|nr:cytochrome P450 [Penicillium brevicompactum]